MPVKRNGIVSLLLALVLAGCAGSSRPEHESQRDPGTDIAAYRDYGWKSAAGEGIGDEPMKMLDVNIRNAIGAELAKRGYKEAEAKPQFLVTYETAAQDKVKSNPVRVGIGIGSFGSSGGGSVNVGSSGVQSYREGKLVIHVIDVAANKEVWYGTVSGRVDKQNIDAEAVAHAVAIAMQDFPPSSALPVQPEPADPH